MKPRKRQPSITRQAVLHSAGVKFAAHGYAATGIGTIVAHASLTKGALFHHFPDKRSLALAWIEEALTEQIAELWNDPLPGVDSLNALVGFFRDRCMQLEPQDAMSALVAITAETAHGDHDLAQALDGVFEAWRASIAAVLERGQLEAWIHPSIQPTAEAGILISMFAGMSVMMKCHGNESFRGESAKSMEAYLETLRPQ